MKSVESIFFILMADLKLYNIEIKLNSSKAPHARVIYFHELFLKLLNTNTLKLGGIS